MFTSSKLNCFWVINYSVVLKFIAFNFYLIKLCYKLKKKVRYYYKCSLLPIKNWYFANDSVIKCANITLLQVFFKMYVIRGHFKTLVTNVLI